jgi:UDP-N-acetylmuramoyl-L-alanyl-D-glutamate--2,6-diaminopimelate ligase
VGGSRDVDLSALLDRLEPPPVVIGAKRRTVNAIEVDSRRVKPGALFVALHGSYTDGHVHAAEAVRNGAVAVVVEQAVDLPAHATVLYVRDSRRALSTLAAAFFYDPSHALDVIGVTGTNGKTTTTHMVAAMLNAAGTPCGVAGTVGAEFRSHRWLLENTTPQPPELQQLLARMRDAGAKAVAMEVSSHALALDRVEDVLFRVAALTNVTRDHLDYHGTLEAYAAAKRRLFALAPACVINADDTYGERWGSELCREGRTLISYGSHRAAILSPQDVVLEPNGSRFTVNGQRYHVRLPGRFNVWNALAAIGVAQLLGVDDATAARGLAQLERVAGRMERIDGGGITVVVDYAHTPDALESALQALRETAEGGLAVVFGCGGDRDRGKRSQMGAIAARLADRLYLTSDNPRTEEPQAIVDEILTGVGERARVVQLDRRAAIELAVSEARRGDVVLVAGKGHEAYQIVGDRVLPFDDRTVARAALAAREVFR